VTLATSPWWQGATIYEVYVRSFQDSNGDGIGDLAGVTQRLPYLHELGVDAIWLTPFFPSPNADFGYDVSDYCGVAPEYGTLADWDALVRAARALGIHVLVDFVLNHTSDQHPWFIEARSSRRSPKRDWYVWQDGRPGGEPPTNWASVFGGPAWTRDQASGQWYYHAFLPQQPDLNWHHPEVRQAMWDVARFWLQRGASGFRLDATAFLFEDPAYPQDPNPEAHPANPLKPYNAGRPENHTVLRELRAVLDAHGPHTVLLGESATDTLAELVAAYGERDDEIQLPMNFLFARHWQRDATGFKRLVDEAQAALRSKTPVPFFSNHDHWRQWSAFGDGVHNDAIAKLTAALVLAQRGTALIYYGEEIGMGDLPEAELAAAPLGPSRPRADHRDRARTPMQWNGGPQAGFSTATPWLPLPAHIGHHHVAAQRADPGSLYHWYRALLALRKSHPALRDGEHVPLESGHSDVLAFGRCSASGAGAVVVLNFSHKPQRVALAGWPGAPLVFDAPLLACPATAAPTVASFDIAPYGALIAQVPPTT
jgi:alpha-glucosidase